MDRQEQYYHHSSFNLYLSQSQIPNAGLGVYTRDHIPPNTLIDGYFGIELNVNMGGDYNLRINDNSYIDASDFPRCYMAMINDCEFIAKKVIKKNKKNIDITPKYNLDANNNPLVTNCKFITDSINNKGYIYSIKHIEPNSELFISYGNSYWS